MVRVNIPEFHLGDLWPGSMENNDFDYIRIDGITRQNVGAGIGDKVLVRSIEVVSANR